jgi:hypothetical protein
MLGLVSLLGCGGTEADDTSGTATTAQTSAVYTETGDQRVGRFEMLPATSIARQHIVPQAWSRASDGLDRIEGADLVGHFDPEMVRVAETYRRTLQAKGGAQ